MQTKNTYIFVPILIASALLAVFSATNALATPSQKALHANFNKSLAPSEVISIVEEYNLQVTELTFEHDEFGGGYTLKTDENISEAIHELQEKHKEFLAYVVPKTKEELRNADNSIDKEMTEKLLAAFEKSQKNPEHLRIKKLDIIKGDIDRLQKSGLVEEVIDDYNIKNVVAQKISTAKTRIFQKLVSPTIASASTSHEPWAPYTGTSEADKNKTYQTFYFNNVSDFGSNSTYEHETQIYNTNYASYAGYWASNMPNKYYDTPFWDDIRVFTVGSSDATKLGTYTKYWTYMSLTPGSASSATIRIKGQKGHRTPSGCYSTWCIFSDATTGSMSYGVNVSSLYNSWVY